MERTILALRHVEDGLLELGAIRSQSFSVRGETRHEGEEALMDMKKAFCAVAAIGLSLMTSTGSAYSQPYIGPGSGSRGGRDYNTPSRTRGQASSGR